MLKRTALGQAISEYSLIIGLTTVVSISGLVMLGNSVRQAMYGMLSAPPPKVSTDANPSPATDPPAEEVADSGNPTSPGPSNANGTTIKLANGTVLQLDKYPTNVAKSVQTTGVNGATNILANNITSIAHQLVQSGDITAAQESQLISLANQAHTIADIEKMVENSLKKNPDKTTLMTTPVTFNNTTYKHVGDLVNEIGILDGALTAGGQLANFNSLLSKINGSGALADPVLNQLINGLASNVQGLADQTENTFWDVTNNGLPPSAFVSTIASETTNKDAANICTAGQGTDSGTSCAQ